MIPVGLSILDTGYRLILGRTGDWPAGFGDPDGLAFRCCKGCLVSSVKERLAVLDGVCHGVLVVRISIHAEEVTVGNNGVIRAVDPCSPRVNVTDWNAGHASIGECGADLLDVIDNVGRLCSGTRVILDASGGDAVEVLGTNRDAYDEACELGFILGDSRCKGGDFVCKVSLACRCPEAKEQSGAGVDGCCDGFGGCVGGATLNHCV